ncbi:hypothetical protein AU194_08995 [Mycobacterium sp. GA-2829]|nr:hypothetical protein AU194_08995 [Mycobacterium sp. GA-2829]
MPKPISAARLSASTPSSRAIAPMSTSVSSVRPRSSRTRRVWVDGAAAIRSSTRAASTAPPRSTSSASSANGAEPCCSQMVPANVGVRRELEGRWMPTAMRGRNPSSGRSATRTTSGEDRSASKMPHCPIQARCSGGPARPRIDSRRSSSASSLDAE